MNLSRLRRFLPLAATFSVVVLSPAQAQRSDLDFGYGVWWSDSVSVVYSVSFHRTLFGPIDYGIGATHLRGLTGVDQRRVTGGELSLGLLRDGSGAYLLAAAGLGMRHSSGDFDAQWSAGGGYGIRPFDFLSVGFEARYRVEDRASRGFWRLDPNDVRGLIVQARVTFGFGGGRGTSRASNRRPAPTISANTPREKVDLRSAVVETAMDVMGTPYRWGGESEGGFDCSGLIQYAYGEHGLILPRTSRNQARMGLQVDLSVAALQPGDILGFSEGAGSVTHVGLYVGDGMFIHSASSGVKLSSLTTTEGDGRWWQQRWVLARRVIN